MSSDVLVSNFKNVGWTDFAPGQFLKVDFDNIGKAKIAKNNWFVLLKSVPVLNMAEIETGTIPISISRKKHFLACSHQENILLKSIRQLLFRAKYET